MLRTFGEPVLLDGDGHPVATLRQKDLALLVFLCTSGGRRYSRAGLATLLWGEGTEANARHSLTQALRRVRRVARSSLETGRMTVDWDGAFPCDASMLTAAVHGSRSDARAAVELYTAPFLGSFDAGPGAEDFQAWAAQKRTELRAFVLRLIESLGREAEERQDWSEALRLGRKAVGIEALFEEGHRRIMRAWCALGERAMALVHYQQYADWIQREFDTDPDVRTQELVKALRASEPSSDGWARPARMDDTDSGGLGVIRPIRNGSPPRDGRSDRTGDVSMLRWTPRPFD